MNIVLTNTGSLALPVVGDQERGDTVPILEAGETYELDDPETVVLSVGDNPSFIEEFNAALAGLAASILALFKRFGAQAEAQAEAPSGPAVSITLANGGPNALRVLCDSNTNDTTLDAGAVLPFSASRYVEIRELGV